MPKPTGTSSVQSTNWMQVHSVGKQLILHLHSPKLFTLPNYSIPVTVIGILAAVGHAAQASLLI